MVCALAATGRTDEARRMADEELAFAVSRGVAGPEVHIRLFVTHKTVEVHLGRAYTKLGVQGRSQLGEALGLA